MNSMHSFAGAVLGLIPVVLSLTVHEFAHAWSAKALGDDTAERLGRLTLNPARHVDPVGTLLLPIFLTMTGAPSFGWAKPVPFDPSRLTRKISVRTGAMLISAAGPLANLVMALLCAGLLSAVFHLNVDEATPRALLELAMNMVPINIALFLFNMIPLGPLDGRKVVSGLLPHDAAVAFESLNERLGVFALLIALFLAPKVLAMPLSYLYGGVLTIVGLG